MEIKADTENKTSKKWAEELEKMNTGERTRFLAEEEPFLVSQSFMKDLVQDPCRHRVYLKHFLGYTAEPSPTMLKGLKFEDLLIGSTRGGEEVEMPKKKDGGKTTDEKRIEELVEYARDRMFWNGISLENVEIQPEWKVYTEEGPAVAHPDLIAPIRRHDTDHEKAIIDVKYTETSETDRWRGWAAPDMIDKTQAIHYTLLSQIVYGEFLPFYYFVFSPYGGFWSKLIRVRVTRETIEEHLAKLGIAYDAYHGLPDSRPTEDPNMCRSCELKEICDAQPARNPIIEVEA